MMERDSYLGRILTGRIYSGVLHIGDKVHGLRNSESGVVKIEEGKVCNWMTWLLVEVQIIALTHFWV